MIQRSFSVMLFFIIAMYSMSALANGVSSSSQGAASATAPPAPTAVSAAPASPSRSETVVSPVSTTIKVEEAAICLDVKDLTPIDGGVVFPSGTPKLYCFTKIVGARTHTSVNHVWYYGSREIARVTLPVKSFSWRTYSSITFYENWPGKWSVAVVSPKNEILKLITFVIEKKQTP